MGINTSNILELTKDEASELINKIHNGIYSLLNNNILKENIYVAIPLPIIKILTHISLGTKLNSEVNIIPHYKHEIVVYTKYCTYNNHYPIIIIPLQDGKTDNICTGR